MDEMVLQVQQWVNATYGDRPGYNKIEENGKTGWSTVYALTRALQLELGITATADNFGDGTASEYRKWGEMELGKVPTDEQGQKIVQIFQGACWCKGYNPGGFNGTFGTSCQSAAMQLQTDAGLPIRDGKVYDYVFKAFLTMDAYVLTSGGDSRIRELQQNLNYNYYTTSGVQPCDGHYQRSTQKAIVYGLQTEIGIAPGSQTGSVGPATQNGLPTLSVGNSGNFVKLFQYLLYVNNFDPGSFDGQYGSGVKSVVITFQEFTLLAADGIAGKQTWLSLLLSTGDPNRKGTACDCITTITPARAFALKTAGYETVGRYLVNVQGGLNKKIQPGELKTIFDAGLTVSPIYQTSGDRASYFNYEQGLSDAKSAYEAARSYGFKEGTTIYFSVDFDALGTEITQNIIPHFAGIKEQLDKFNVNYMVGVYGTRNVCIQVSNFGYASTSFVSGMSTGYSGNLGYPLPSNWAFDQISTITVGSGDGYIEIDNNIKSEKDSGVSSIDNSEESDDNAEFFKFLNNIQTLALEYADNDIETANKLVLDYYRSENYTGALWILTSGPINVFFVDFVNNYFSLDSMGTLIDPISGVEIDIEHMMATMSAYVGIDLPVVEDTVRALAGWGGDLVTAVRDIYDHREEYEGTSDEQTKLAAYDYIGAESPRSGHFSYSDLLSDVDAVNIAYILLKDSSKTIYDAFKEYYVSGYTGRFTSFFKNEFDGTNAVLVDNGLYVMVGDDEVINLAREKLKNFTKPPVPDYTQSEGIIISMVFANKILDLME